MSTTATHSTALLAPESPGALAAQADHLSASQWYTAEQVAQRVQLVQQIYRNVMKQDTHYGIIPGCKKPSLWKAGSELLLMAFRIALTPKAEDLSTQDCARYRVTVEATHAPSTIYLGAGIGEACTDETKYKWRASVCDMEFDATPADRRQITWKKGERGAYSVAQVRTNVADVANTALKIAKKRAQIDATLTITGCSDMFTQDLEDMEYPMVEGEGEAEGAQPKQAAAAVQMPRRAGAAPAQQNPDAEPPEQEQPHQTQATPPPIQPRSYIGEPQQRQAQPQQQSSNFRGQQAQQHREAPAQSARTPVGDKISEGQDKRFFAIAMGNGITKPEIKNYLEQTWGISSSRDLVKGDCYEQAVAWAEGTF